MDADAAEMLDDFVSGPLVTWMQTLESLMNSRSDQPHFSQEKRHECPKEYFLGLISGDFLIHTMEIIDQIPGGGRPPWNEQTDEARRLQMLQTLVRRLRGFYQNDLQQLILSPPPNIHLLARDPLTVQAMTEMRKLVLLLLGSAVQVLRGGGILDFMAASSESLASVMSDALQKCERRDEIIGLIQTLDIHTQAALASAIQEVTQEPENMLRTHWKELGPAEMEQLLRDVMSRICKLAHERDAGLEKLWELQQAREMDLVPPPENSRPHFGVQLAETRAQVRRLQQELEEKLEELLDQQDELKDLEGQLQKLRQENRALAGEARLATLYRDELDALREKALRTERLQAELAALRERLPGLERCRAQLKEEREFSQALLETKAMLEGQLESAHARGQRLNQLEKEALHLQSRLNQAQEERDQLHHQAEELLRENVALERKLRRSFGESLDILRTEELECDWAPSELPEVPDALSYEAQEAGRLVALERENQELRRKLQEALENPTETRSVDAALKATLRDGEQSQVDLEAGEQASETGGGLPEALKQPGSSQEELASGTGERQALDPAAEAKVAGLEAALAEAWARLAEAEQLREAESHRASGLEDRLRGLERAQAEARQKQAHEQEQWRGEAERLADEVLALEREREALRAGSQALQAAATQAELELGEARQRLQSEQLHAAQLAQEAQRAAEDLGEARRESEALQRSLEQHKAVLARLEAEKGALEESLAQAEERQRQSDKESRRLKAQAQAQAEALADQGLCLVQLEAQLQQHQGAELSSLREATQRLGAREQEAAGREELPLTKCDAPAVLEEELQKEKEKGKEGEAALVQVKEQLLKKEKRGEADVEDRKSREEKQEGLSVGKAVVEEEHSSLGKQPEEPQALQRRSTSPPAKSGGALPLLLEALPGTQKELSSNLRANPGSEALSTRLIEVERQNAVLQAEKSALSGRVGQLESQLSSLQGALLGLQGRSSEAKEENGRWQAQNSALQVEAASLRSRQALLESQLSELRQRLVLLESEARGAQQEREQWRGRHEALLRDHDRLTVLHERQAADLEGLMGKHTSLKASLRSLEHEYRDLKGRHDQLLGEKTGLEQREEALRAQKKNLGEAELQHRQLVERHHNLEEEHERVKQKLGQMERARDDLQGELQGMRNRVTGLQLEQARLEAESATLKEQNQQLDMALGRLSTQCELLAQLKGNQEEENRHLFQETQALSRENRRLLEHSMESREQFQEEQRQYLDKLGELRREKQKLVEKIMDQYRVLEPSLPRGKKGNWLSEKFKKLMKPRRESPREQIRPMAEGAGSSESLTGQEGPRTDGSSSPAPLCKASSTVSLADAQQMHLRRCRLSSRMPAVDSPGDGEGQDTPRQRFRQRRLGMLGGSQEEAIIAAAEWEVPRQSSTSSQEERGPPLGEEEQSPKRQH